MIMSPCPRQDSCVYDQPPRQQGLFSPLHYFLSLKSISLNSVFHFPLGEQLQGLGFIQVASVFGLRHPFQADVLFILMSFSFYYGKTMPDT